MIFKKFKLAFASVFFGTLALWSCTNAKPPTDLLSKTEVEVEKAKEFGAQQHAPVELLDAEDKLARAKSAMDGEQYAKAENLLEEAMVDAEHASIKSRSVKAKSAASTVNEDIQVLREELEQQDAGKDSGNEEYSRAPGEYSGEGDY
ncbi:MAG TPA: DUF4398 domain-containing protein [Gammaproteobacteria bacterium]|nr:DUF4398 domain-containing protein [Gammaproteobacteria bacterium]